MVTARSQAVGLASFIQRLPSPVGQRKSWLWPERQARVTKLSFEGSKAQGPLDTDIAMWAIAESCTPTTVLRRNSIPASLLTLSVTPTTLFPPQAGRPAQAYYPTPLHRLG